MTLVRISDPTRLQHLLADLLDSSDLIAEVVSDDTLLLDLLGSYDVHGMQIALVLRLRAWEEAQRARGIDVALEILD